MWIRRDASSLCIETPAKLNLFLEILGRRADGYHELETLMVPINICDTLIVAPTDNEEVEFTCDWAAGWRGWAVAEQRLRRTPPLVNLPPAAENLAYRALRLLQSRHGVRQGARVELVKRIPAAAGLGGASSDAAAALVAGNLAWKLDLSAAELHALAAELGSDVPFFLQGGAAVCKGRGEQIAPLAWASRLNVVVVRPPVGLSTADVYRRCRAPSSPRSSQALVNLLSRGELGELGSAMFNRLQEPARELSPWIETLAHEFERFDCLAHQMTGSGSSYFGVCRSRAQALRVAQRLRARRLGSVFCSATCGQTRREILPTIA